MMVELKSTGSGLDAWPRFISHFIHPPTSFQIIGGIDEKLYTGPMLYALLHREWYYEVVITQMKVEDDDVGLDCKEVRIKLQRRNALVVLLLLLFFPLIVLVVFKLYVVKF